ncbi:MAG: ElyC/SanA/YdcF family protein [Patescibacteria group bacterium]
MKTAVLIHGCHLQAEGWENIIWGNPEKGILGRVPKGIFEALKWNSDIMIFSTGASEKNGVKEGKYIFQYALQRLEEMISLIPDPTMDLRAFVQERARLELSSQNTREEVLASARLAHAEGIERLVLVSSPSHILRAHKDAISALGSDPELRYLLRNLYATASDTCFQGTTVEDVVIIEPPHRGDRPKNDLYKHAREMFRIPADTMTLFTNELRALLQKYIGG